MARNQPMDVAGASFAPFPVIARTALPLLLSCALLFSLPSVSQQAATLSDARQLFEAERWPELAALMEASPRHSVDLEYYYGMALAHLNRMEEARNALVAGSRLNPRDQRFPVELAGVAFRLKRYNQATRYLHRALDLDPTDAYATDFLATVYFVQGNLEAALRYWNRIDKPFLDSLHTRPDLRVNPVLLDHAFAFSPTETLTLGELLATEARLHELEIFPRFRLELAARPDGKFDASLEGAERNGWGNSTLEGLLNLLGGLPYQQVSPEYFNIRGEAINLVSLLRWDAEKRRAQASLAGPFRRSPKWRFSLAADLRSENWDIRDAATSRPAVASFNLRREEAEAEITRLVGGRLSWSAGLRMSRRDHRDVVAGAILTPSLLASGYQLVQTTRLRHDWLRLPEKRLNVSAEATSGAGRIFTAPSQSFARLQASLAPHWLPQARGNDYETRWKLQAGGIWGQPPFDELFMLGLDRDNNLLLRGHTGIHRGRKGSAPLGRNYFLANWETDKELYKNGIVSLKMGPFFDTGRITGALAPETGQWLYDAGAQAKIAVLGIGITLSYGRDLRHGRNVFYANTSR
ncbi:MAG TPA: tetratricopeptide repeat protein [Candidatus Saccharimonadales bacterium]|jgi:tetratricopeptide (TPR) repeat protein|nr:tetratricopeptide repeat protein [Candidatus Saccharimonadales bacterium]